MHRTLTIENVETALAEYCRSIEHIGENVQGKFGLELLQEVKRAPTRTGPYAHVTLFEAANRIMTDLVILNGVKWMLERRVFPFSEYRVEYGNEDFNAHDIMADNGREQLIGEAFNVAPSFFQGKKFAMLRKLRAADDAMTFRLLLVNADAVNQSYVPNLRSNEYMVLVGVSSGWGKIWPDYCIQRTSEDANE